MLASGAWTSTTDDSTTAAAAPSARRSGVSPAYTVSVRTRREAVDNLSEWMGHACCTQAMCNMNIWPYVTWASRARACGARARACSIDLLWLSTAGLLARHAGAQLDRLYHRCVAAGAAGATCPG
jgi:hypothetical protein